MNTSRTLRDWLIGIGCLSCVWSSAYGQIPSDRNARLAFSGYARMLASGQSLGYDLPAVDGDALVSGAITRLKWRFQATESIHLSVHNRIQALYTSSSTRGGTVGFGVSSMPNRSVPLETYLVDDTHIRVWHDLDRLSLTVLTGAVDLKVGRQALTWGSAAMFPVADLWAQFSPFELDTEEKPGVDAVRALMYPVPGAEVDVVVADRGSARDLSFGVRVTADLPDAEVYGAIGKFWRQVIGLGGASAVVDIWTIRGELAVRFPLDPGETRTASGTIGIDRIGAEQQWSFEYHLNGLGATDPAMYAGRLAGSAVTRGETYYLGRHYLGGVGAHQINDETTITASLLINVLDPGAVLFPGVVYQPGQSTRITAGILLSAGNTTVASPEGDPVIRGEFGSYGHHLFLTISVFF